MRFRKVSIRKIKRSRSSEPLSDRLLNLVSTGGYYGAYVVVLVKTLAGGISIGTFTFLTSAFARSRGYIERILSGFNDISEQAIFLQDLFEFFAMEPSIRSVPEAIPAPGRSAKGSNSAT